MAIFAATECHPATLQLRRPASHSGFVCNVRLLDPQLQHRPKLMSELTGGEGDPEGRYANFFKVGFNAYEFVIDFGQQYQPAAERIHTRIVTSPSLARNLRDVLDRSVREYEAREEK